ncbi:TonB-dependent receptor [Chitinophaga sp.]|uniref:TonB-dependent receptor n=1 Tax=Chitinophaga sp. TaxID=1869181 RepID=UPI0031CF3461
MKNIYAGFLWKLVSRHAMAVSACICVALPSTAQPSYTISGSVRSETTKAPLAGARIDVLPIEQFALSGHDGAFLLKDVPAGKYRLSVTRPGFAPVLVDVTVPGPYLGDITLRERIMGLREISVTARPRILGSSSIIDKSAIIHTQPVSLADVLQLVPGQLATNPNLGAAQQTMLRQASATTDASRASALGTQVVMDGVPVSNNANLQSDVTILNSAPGALPPFSSVAGRGNDLRQIPADNIENIEVIRGIPGARFGDLTSGLILVQSRIGVMQPELRTRVNPDLVQLAWLWGFQGKNKNSTFNVGADLARSRADVRDRLNQYSRFQGQLSWQQAWGKAKRFSTTNILSAYKTLDKQKQSPDDLRYQNTNYADDYGVKVSSEGKWEASRPWLQNLHYTVALTASRQSAYYQTLVTRDVFPLSDATTDTTQQGFFGKSEYLNQTTVDGRPVNGYARLEASAVKSTGALMHRLSAGAEWRMDVNFGEGRQFNPLYPPRQNYSMGDRPRSYASVPALHQLAYYAEDKVSASLGDRKLMGQFGLRLDNVAPRGIFRSRYKTIAAPRINLAAEVVRNLWLRGGYGIAAKAPPLSYLYPGNRYFDLVNFNYFAENPAERLAIITTRVIKLDGLQLNPYTAEKWEFGFDLEQPLFSANISFFNETTRNAIAINRELKAFAYDKFKAIEKPVGAPPVLGYERTDTFFAPYDVPVNNRKIMNRGVEYAIDIPEIRNIRTSFNITGAYIRTETYDNGPFIDAAKAYQGATVPELIGIYRSSGRVVSSRMNTSVRFIHRFPQLNMIFSALWQTVWISRNSPVPLGIYPEAVLNRRGEVILLSPEQAKLPEYESLIRVQSDLRATAYPPLHLFNLRLTKEWKNGAGFSFYANNFLNYRPLHYDANLNGLIRRNEPLFFGAEFNFRLTKKQTNK